jgi:hypothetical protein
MFLVEELIFSNAWKYSVDIDCNGPHLNGDNEWQMKSTSHVSQSSAVMHRWFKPHPSAPAVFYFSGAEMIPCYNS